MSCIVQIGPAWIGRLYYRWAMRRFRTWPLPEPTVVGNPCSVCGEQAGVGREVCYSCTYDIKPIPIPRTMEELGRSASPGIYGGMYGSPFAYWVTEIERIRPEEPF